LEREAHARGAALPGPDRGPFAPGIQPGRAARDPGRELPARARRITPRVRLTTAPGRAILAPPARRRLPRDPRPPAPPRTDGQRRGPPRRSAARGNRGAKRPR